MAQEQFAGPEYFDSFDPEKFIKELQEKQQDTQGRRDGNPVQGENSEQS